MRLTGKKSFSDKRFWRAIRKNRLTAIQTQVHPAHFCDTWPSEAPRAHRAAHRERSSYPVRASLPLTSSLWGHPLDLAVRLCPGRKLTYRVARPLDLVVRSRVRTFLLGSPHATHNLPTLQVDTRRAASYRVAIAYRQQRLPGSLWRTPTSHTTPRVSRKKQHQSRNLGEKGLTLSRS